MRLPDDGDTNLASTAGDSHILHRTSTHASSNRPSWPDETFAFLLQAPETMLEITLWDSCEGTGTVWLAQSVVNLAALWEHPGRCAYQKLDLYTIGYTPQMLSLSTSATMSSLPVSLPAPSPRPLSLPSLSLPSFPPPPLLAIGTHMPAHDASTFLQEGCWAERGHHGQPLRVLGVACSHRGSVRGARRDEAMYRRGLRA